MNGREFLLGGCAAVALGAGLISPQEANAQAAQGTIVTQSASKADVATFFQTTPQAQTSCTTVGSTVANTTITITPPAGNYVYLTGLYIEVIEGDTTGTASTVAWTSTNLTGSPVWVTRDDVNATVSPAQHQFELMEIYPTDIKSTVAGTAVTIVPAATSAHQAFCAHAVGYYNPT